MRRELRDLPVADRLPGGAAYAICNRCVMDTSDPEISFDGSGHCNHCTEYTQLRAGHTAMGGSGSDVLEEQLERIRDAGRGREYDCVIGVSGGVDSSFLAYLVTERFGLRPLAVHMDNGWDSGQAVANIRRVIDGLNMAYESVVLDWPSFRTAQLAFLRASVPEAETPTDVAIPEALHSTAARYGIRYILSAGNLITEGILPRSWQYNARDAKYFRSICGESSDLSRGLKFYDYRREVYFKMLAGIRTVYPLNHVAETEEEILKILIDRLGFAPYPQKHYESLYTRFIQSYYLVKKFGIDYRRATYSSLIMNGQATRAEALETLSRPPFSEATMGDDLEYIARKLQVSLQELNEIIESPAKYFWQYPNDEKKLAFIYSAYRVLSRKNKLASV